MRSETRGNGKITRQRPVAEPKKRGRPRKRVPSVIEELKAKDAPEIKFLRDLVHHDPTEVTEGADKGKVYRWVEESRIRMREAQGYSKVDDKDVKTHYDGNYMPAEGSDARKVNRGGMVLMEIPKTLHDLRVRAKEEKVERQMQEMDSTMVSNMTGHGSTPLADADEFVQETVNRG